MLTLEQRANMNKFIRALRGEDGTVYKQGHYALKRLLPDDTPQYCCLGVAAEGVLGKQFVFGGGDILRYGEGSTVYLPAEDEHKLGLGTEVTEEEYTTILCYVTENKDELLYSTTRQEVLMWLNDVEQMSFKDMADLLEELEWNR